LAVLARRSQTFLIGFQGGKKKMLLLAWLLVSIIPVAIELSVALIAL